MVIVTRPVLRGVFATLTIAKRIVTSARRFNLAAEVGPSASFHKRQSRTAEAPRSMDVFSPKHDVHRYFPEAHVTARPRGSGREAGRPLERGGVAEPRFPLRVDEQLVALCRLTSGEPTCAATW